MLKAVDNVMKRFKESQAESWAASLSFYTLLSLPALFAVILGIVKLVTNDGQLEQLWTTLSAHTPYSASSTTLVELASSGSTATFGWSVAVSLIIALFATGKLFTHLPIALAQIWHTPPPPPDPRARLTHAQKAMKFVKKRLQAMLPVLILIASLTVLVTLYTGLQILTPLLAAYLSWNDVVIPILISILFVVLTALICGTFFYIYSRKQFDNQQYIIAGSITALLLLLGQLGISLYFWFIDVTKGFGTLGSAVLLLIWLYYSYNTFLLGATTICSVPSRQPRHTTK